MKIVLDTNVLVSGLLQPFGPSGQIVRLVASGDLILCHDPRILAEYQEVLLRKKFSFDPERVEILLEEIRAGGIPVAARPLAVRLPDSDDEPFLEVALAGGAQCLVTGNARHYPDEARSGAEVLSPRAFIDLYRAQLGGDR
ncbi:MAG TPA: putative toxin-antitoxin system toxin component, PIN family [Thermoanaerobaculia bacterium]|jgi:putative PIN family toxin of toxin-antitoxin system|nr:putative toxin-antitoxin system toxin component, PIN family [Thermoanaerobaculia bacterium]